MREINWEGSARLPVGELAGATTPANFVTAKHTPEESGESKAEERTDKAIMRAVPEGTDVSPVEQSQPGDVLAVGRWASRYKPSTSKSPCQGRPHLLFGENARMLHISLQHRRLNAQSPGSCARQSTVDCSCPFPPCQTSRFSPGLATHCRSCSSMRKRVDTSPQILVTAS